MSDQILCQKCMVGECDNMPKEIIHDFTEYIVKKSINPNTVEAFDIELFLSNVKTVIVETPYIGELQCEWDHTYMLQFVAINDKNTIIVADGTGHQFIINRWDVISYTPICNDKFDWKYKTNARNFFNYTPICDD